MQGSSTATAGSIGDTGEDPTGDETGGSSSGSTSSSSSGAETGSTTSGATTTGDGVRLDVGPDETGGPTPGQGCDKVDFLFVVDGSGSILDEQQRMAESFPEFMEVIEQTLELEDFHVMVVDVDAVGLDCYRDSCPFPGVQRCNAALCAGIPPEGTCAAELGGGRVTDLEGAMCPVEGGNPYIVAGQPDLAATFTCMGIVGGGDLESLPMSAMIRALSPEMNAPGACNAGFLREDAILVVTFITDEVDHSPPDPEGWHDAVLAVKHDDPRAVIVLGIMRLTSGDPMNAFVDLFTYGAKASIDEPSYTPFFLDAVSNIDHACDDFIPPG